MGFYIDQTILIVWFLPKGESIEHTTRLDFFSKTLKSYMNK